MMVFTVPEESLILPEHLYFIIKCLPENETYKHIHINIPYCF